MYMPKLARFTARDPFPEDGAVLLDGNSTYSYAANNPVNQTDPSGQQSPVYTGLSSIQEEIATFHAIQQYIGGNPLALIAPMQSGPAPKKPVKCGLRTSGPFTVPKKLGGKVRG